MLQELTIKNLALFKDLSVQFGKGLNILTGETGAGKSILVGSALLALGGRYTSDMIRAGEDSAYIEMCFTIDDDKQKDRLLGIDEELDLAGGELIISRRLAEGRSSGRINGEHVTQKKLRAFASVLLDVHGQRDSQVLLEEGGHKALLDAYGDDGLADLKRETEEAYRALKEIERQMNALGSDDAQRQREIDLLTYEVSEIRGADLAEGEDEELEAVYARLVNAQAIMEGLSHAQEALSGAGGGASDLISRSVRELASVSTYDSQIASLYDQVSEIDTLLSDATREISEYADSFEFSEAEVDRVSRRLDQINRLKAKYGGSVESILEAADNRERRLALLADAEQTLEDLSKEKCLREEELLDKCSLLTTARNEYARLMEEEIRVGLNDLGFADDRFEIRIERAEEPAEDGYDRVRFYIGPNPGEGMHELSQIASGGELSRIMLAIKAAMAGKEQTKTLIFDEIDAGISGRTADAVAQKLGAIADTHQVICITHLAQIAAMADSHYLIEKSVVTTDGQEETVTHIDKLGYEETIKELGRILAGASVTEAALTNARELKKFAEQYKKGALDE